MAALVLTGGGWLICRYALAEVGEFGPLPHPRAGLWLALHGAAAMVALVLFGFLAASHMLRAWAVGRGRTSGGGLAALFGVLAITGYGLYYIGDDSLRGWTSVAHWAIGLALPVWLTTHVWRLRTKLRRVRSS